MGFFSCYFNRGFLILMEGTLQIKMGMQVLLALDKAGKLAEVAFLPYSCKFSFGKQNLILLIPIQFFVPFSWC